MPLRTLARTQVLASAESLGVTLSKPQLRKAIDHTVKLFKSRVEDGDAKIGVRGTVDDAPSLVALGQHIESLDSPMSGRAIGLLEERGREHAAIYGGSTPPPTRGPIESPHTPSPWSSVYVSLDESVQMLTERVRQLLAKLGPVLLPSPAPESPDTAQGRPTGTPHVLEGVELQRTRIDNVRARIAGLIDRVIV